MTQTESHLTCAYTWYSAIFSFIKTIWTVLILKINFYDIILKLVNKDYKTLITEWWNLI